MNPETPNPSPAAPSDEDMRAIYSAASRYLRALYADQPSPHATKDNAVRLARIAESLHAKVGREIGYSRYYGKHYVRPADES